jgi:hypothetical protein
MKKKKKKIDYNLVLLVQCVYDPVFDLLLLLFVVLLMMT